MMRYHELKIQAVQKWGGQCVKYGFKRLEEHKRELSVLEDPSEETT